MAVVEFGVLETILTLCLLIFAAKVGGETAQRLGVAAVVGELVAGILIGPSLLGGIRISGYQLVVINDTVRIFAEIAAILLLFMVGLETRFAEFRKTGTTAGFVALGGVLLPFLLGYGLVTAVGRPHNEALLMGAVLTATSIVITVKTLYDIGKEKTPESRIIVGAAVADDVLGLVALAVVLAVIGGGSLSVGDTLLISAKAIAAWVALTLAGVFLFSRIIATTAPLVRTRGGLEALAVAACFGFAYLTGIMGLAPILGAFAAGMAIAETRIIEEVRRFAEKVNFMMAPLFFTVIGTMVDLSAFSASSIAFAAALIALAVLSKVLGCGLPAYLVGRDGKTAAIIGVAMVSRGEVGLIIAGIGATSGIFSPEVFSAAVLMVVVTTVLTPVALKFLYWRFEEEVRVEVK